MSEPTQREKLVKEEQVLREIIEEHQYEIDMLKVNIKDVQTDS